MSSTPFAREGFVHPEGDDEAREHRESRDDVDGRRLTAVFSSGVTERHG